MNDIKEKKQQPIVYYGKKAYRVHPLIARIKEAEIKYPDYGLQIIDDQYNLATKNCKDRL